ncbi:MAG: DUF4124 domain-containing protein [Cellvibrionaceae bacterium]|nr:DUF4124 domain-containing protein [Cellvibrionaceae bacterium]
MRQMTPVLLLTLLLACSGAGATTVYECTNAEGKKVYTDKLCKGKTSNVKEYKVAPPLDVGTSTSLQKDYQLPHHPPEANAP